MRLWSKAAAFGIIGCEKDGVYVDAIKEMESRNDISSVKQRKRFSQLIKKEKFGLCLVQETKLQKVDESFVGERFIGLNVLWKGVNIYVINVYAACCIQRKRRFWSDMLNFKEKFLEGEWCVGGDFNAIKVEAKRRGCSRAVNCTEMDEFNSFMNRMELVDVGLVGRNFSWFSFDGTCCSRICRFLLTEGLLDLWKVENQVIGSRELSDHFPIWFKGNVRNWGPKPFKIFNAWMKHAEFYSFVEKCWLDAPISNRFIYPFKEKLKFLRSKLRVWNVKVFDLLDLQEENAFKELNALDFAMMGDNPVDIDSLAINRLMASKKMWEVVRHKESFLRQKARALWLKDGDSNSRFFHKVINSRNIRNKVDSWIDDVGVVKEEVRRHFESRFSENTYSRPILEGVNFVALSSDDSLNLEGMFLEEEVKDVIWSSDGDKSPGPDGFNMGFYKVCWPF
ncbi:uncharacterized protein LOC131623395 [Vicia villosa]|uniref:uncharacterized protein LOC131623395 n=1 Tax=Vicia villosa TaxID=3911 RepID=UPI00273CF1F2|nr:uncharacterized protein LOC131623395 [Vicia villosa]